MVLGDQVSLDSNTEMSPQNPRKAVGAAVKDHVIEDCRSSEEAARPNRVSPAQAGYCPAGRSLPNPARTVSAPASAELSALPHARARGMRGHGVTAKVAFRYLEGALTVLLHVERSRSRGLCPRAPIAILAIEIATAPAE